MNLWHDKYLKEKLTCDVIKTVNGMWDNQSNVKGKISGMKSACICVVKRKKIYVVIKSKRKKYEGGKMEKKIHCSWKKKKRQCR